MTSGSIFFYQNWLNFLLALWLRFLLTKAGNKAVQEAFSGKAYYNCMVAVVFTNNHYTAAAIETARVTNVMLWDREKLIEFLKNYKK